jgi:hypothetical protein
VITMQPALFARIADAFGSVEKKLPGSTTFRPLSVGDRVPVATVLRTANDAALLVELPDKHVVRVGANSTVVLNQLGQDKQFALKVLSGQVWALVKKANHPTKFTVETSSGVAGVTGTFFAVGLDQETQEMIVSTGEGSVEVQSYDDGGAPLGEPVAVREGMMIRAARLRAKLTASRQIQEHQAMWRLLYREGGWAQQRNQGALRLTRGREPELWRYLHQKSLPGKLPGARPTQPTGQKRRPGGPKPGIWRR